MMMRLLAAQCLALALPMIPRGRTSGASGRRADAIVAVSRRSPRIGGA
jgi:hypothetical protein